MEQKSSWNKCKIIMTDSRKAAETRVKLSRDGEQKCNWNKSKIIMTDNRSAGETSKIMTRWTAEVQLKQE